jgi:hypothetical protein
MLLALRPGYRSAMRFSDVTTLTGNTARSAHHFYCIYCFFKGKKYEKNPGLYVASNPPPPPGWL